MSSRIPRSGLSAPKGCFHWSCPRAEAALESYAILSTLNQTNISVLRIAWLLATLREHGPYPVLTVIGEQGSAKSTLIELLRLLVDPNVANLRAPPREDRDLFISAGNSHVLAYDNLSGLPPWLSDGLARISTGAAYASRALYTDQEEVLVRAEKPIALNGITDIVSRADLADRCIFVTADRILDKDRKPKEEVMAAFEAERASILGALLDAVAGGIRTLPGVTGGDWPRMADFAKWATACESGFCHARVIQSRISE